MTQDELWSVYLRFNRRLKKLGIQIECTNNCPWIYIDKVNGKPVQEKLFANHGFTAFWYPVRLGDKVEFSDRREVFRMIREMVKE